MNFTTGPLVIYRKCIIIAIERILRINDRNKVLNITKRKYEIILGRTDLIK